MCAGQAAVRKLRLIFVSPLALGIATAFLLTAGFARGEDDTDFNVHKEDDIVLKGGEVLHGKIWEQDDGSYKFSDGRISRTLGKDMISVVRKKATKEEELERLAKKYANDPANMLRIATKATTRYNLNAKVIPILERFTAAKTDEGTLQLLGTLYLNADQTDKALRIGEKLMATGPQKPRNLMLRGQALAALGKLDEAEADLAKAYKASSQDDDIVLAYANLQLKQGRSESAKKIFTDVVAANPRNPSALSGLGFVQLRTGDFSAAEQSFQQALAINAEYRNALIGLATSEMMNKRYDDSFADCNRILNIDNNCAEALAIQAFSMIYKGDPASLARVDDKNYIKDSLEAKPNQPRLVLAWAAMLDRQAKFDDFKTQKDKDKDNATGGGMPKRLASAQKYNEVLASDAQDSYIQYFIGERRFREAEEAKRRNDPPALEAALTKAEEAYKRAAKLSPSYGPANGALGATLLRRKKWDEAKAAFAKAAEADSKSPDAADYFAGQGLALLQSQKFDEASALFKKALDLDPNNAPAHCGRGYIANWERDKDRAVDGFQKALAADGDCAYAAAALQLIYKQDDREMEYVHFSGSEWPLGWKPYSPGQLKLSLSNGQAVVAGTQGSSQGARLDLSKNFAGATKFERLEADLSISPASPTQFGLRIASGSGPNPAFELQFGKDESNELKVWVRDSTIQNAEWKPTGKEWPSSGRARLGIETDGITANDCMCRVFVNGSKIGTIKLNFQAPPKSLSLGVFLIGSPNQTVNATINNIAIVKRGVSESKQDNSGDSKFIAEPAKPDEKK